ncbi:DinB family protein [Actinoplanes sp. KI2]|uniref:DinB family protein n=1 Tax=Actinoplanes sp. KI2 TaxID=2983315 RepID=UPI0021D5D9E8|nr:DinB family protein [Actinoplanes sp. KI2]MCU7730245.1 DinB family protein [Actinoplanes sp. KI2]
MGFAWSNMFVTPEDDPRTDGGFTGERDTLIGYLRDQRLTLELKCADLDASELAARAVEPSPMSLLGLVRHMARVEQNWFRVHMAGFQAQRHYRLPDDHDFDFHGAIADPAVVDEAFATWRSEIAFAEDYVDSIDDLGYVGDGGLALREVLVHMIEEYARHNGHADFLRERIDGRIGQ